MKQGHIQTVGSHSDLHMVCFLRIKKGALWAPTGSSVIWQLFRVARIESQVWWHLCDVRPCPTWECSIMGTAYYVCLQRPLQDLDRNWIQGIGQKPCSHLPGTEWYFTANTGQVPGNLGQVGHLTRKGVGGGAWVTQPPLLYGWSRSGGRRTESEAPNPLKQNNVSVSAAQAGKRTWWLTSFLWAMNHSTDFHSLNKQLLTPFICQGPSSMTRRLAFHLVEEISVQMTTVQWANAPMNEKLHIHVPWKCLYPCEKWGAHFHECLGKAGTI